MLLVQVPGSVVYMKIDAKVCFQGDHLDAIFEDLELIKPLVQHFVGFPRWPPGGHISSLIGRNSVEM
jgi:hypothetical protein